jgi:hypothetical protein
VTDGTGSDPDPPEPGGETPHDRHGNVLTERARDRSGVIAFMARNGVAANLLMFAMLVAGLFSFSTITQEAFPENSLDTISVSVRHRACRTAERYLHR